MLLLQLLLSTAAAAAVAAEPFEIGQEARSSFPRSLALLHSLHRCDSCLLLHLFLRLCGRDDQWLFSLRGGAHTSYRSGPRPQLLVEMFECQLGGLDVVRIVVLASGGNQPELLPILSHNLGGHLRVPSHGLDIRPQGSIYAFLAVEQGNQLVNLLADHLDKSTELGNVVDGPALHGDGHASAGKVPSAGRGELVPQILQQSIFFSKTLETVAVEGGVGGGVLFGSLEPVQGHHLLSADMTWAVDNLVQDVLNFFSDVGLVQPGVSDFKVDWFVGIWVGGACDGGDHRGGNVSGRRRDANDIAKDEQAALLDAEGG